MEQEKEQNSVEKTARKEGENSDVRGRPAVTLWKPNLVAPDPTYLARVHAGSEKKSIVWSKLIGNRYCGI